MKTKAVRLYGKGDLRLETFELPPMADDEILVQVITDSLCMSSYKATNLGPDHKRVPDNVAENPVIIGHEFCGIIIEVGSKWKAEFQPGDKFVVQPSLGELTLDAAGYSFPFFGGDITYAIIPNVYLEQKCILPYQGDAYFKGSLGEPYSCVAGTYKAHYHTRNGSYTHLMGIREGGNMAMLAAAGPMGLAALDYILHCDRRPGKLVVTDISEERLARIEKLLPAEHAAKNGIQLEYVNTAQIENPEQYLKDITGGKGFDDILVFAPVKPLVEQADRLLAFDGCLNFFAGPADPNFKAEFNFFNAHYANTHIVATNAGNTDDLKESVEMMEKNLLTPAFLVTHIGGLDAVVEATKSLPSIPGSKKLVYTNISLPLTSLDELEEKGKDNELLAKLAVIVKQHNGLWNKEAEDFILEHGQTI